MRKKLGLPLAVVLSLAVIAGGCAPGPEESANGEPEENGEEVVLTLATTTSTYDSGLLDELLPEFEEETGYDVEVIAVGTGQALEIGRSGDADVLLVHAPELEEEFVGDGYGTGRTYLMYNDFILLGPEDDPAGLAQAGDMEEAMDTIAAAGDAGDIKFTSRGDDSGTHAKELELWDLIDLRDEVNRQAWYNSLGQGMGDTLVATNEMQAYTMADRGTFLAMEEDLPRLEILFEGAQELENPYGIIPVSPDEHPRVKHEAAAELVEFLVRDDVQEMIGEFGVEEYGQPLFFPDAE